MRLIATVILLFFFLVCTGTTRSYGISPGNEKQKIISRHKYKEAEQLINDGNYAEASVLYKELLEKSPRNPDLNFKLGTCYLNMASEKEKSVELLEKAVQYTSSKYNVPVDVYFNLGKAYHTNYKFRKALKVFNDLLQIISPQNKDFRNEISREIEMCENGLELIQNPVNISITNLGNLINTEFDEHSPGVTADESTMVFTSRRNGTGGKVDKDGQYFEDIYISHYVNGEWTKPKGINKLNTIDHDASISISADGQILYIYKAGYYSKKESEGGDIYMSHLEGSKWSEPQKLGPSVNSPYKETHISISANGQSIYFTSDRPGGYGGMDIYVVNKLPNGKWGLASNLGPVINTEYDEDGPFIHPDGHTLYFSSRGHKTMGGLDIFKSTNIEGRWSTPINVGYPINSTNDDVYYTPTPDGKRAYFSSYRKGSLGRTDIFLIKTPDSDQKGLFVLKGKVLTTGGSPVGYARITVTKEGEVVGIYNPNSASGKFLFIVEAGKTYEIEVAAEGYRTLRTRLNIPTGYANTENHSVITLLPLTLRTHDEPDYPESLKLIDFEESHISGVEAVLSKSDGLPDIKEFDKAKLDKPQDSLNMPGKDSVAVTPTKVMPKTIVPEPQKEKNTIEKKGTESQGATVPVVIGKKIIPIHTTTPAKKKELSKEKIIKKTPAVTPSRKEEGLSYTLELAVLETPDADLFKTLKDVKVIKGEDQKYHYTYGNFKDYKAAGKAQKELKKKGYGDIVIRMASNEHLIEEVKNTGEIYYTIQVMALQLPIDAEFFNNLDNVKVFQGKDGLTRYTYRKFMSFGEALKVLDKVIRAGYWDAFIRTVINGYLIDPNMGFQTESRYTIQVMALRNPKPLHFFNDLGEVKMHTGGDGIYRYTYRTYRTKEEAQIDLSGVLRKGYWDAFIRRAFWGENVGNAPVVDHTNYYTIQVMALRYPKSLNYFAKLGEDNMTVFKGQDSLSRYTYQTFKSRSEAQNRLQSVFKKGYWDAFTREIKWYKKH